MGDFWVFDSDGNPVMSDTGYETFWSALEAASEMVLQFTDDEHVQIVHDEHREDAGGDGVPGECSVLVATVARIDSRVGPRLRVTRITDEGGRIE